MGCEALDHDADFNKPKAGGNITFKAAAGRDGISIKPWTFRYYFYKVIRDEDGNFIKIDYPTETDKDGNIIYYSTAANIKDFEDDNGNQLVEPEYDENGKLKNLDKILASSKNKFDYLESQGAKTDYTTTIKVPDYFGSTEQYFYYWWR